MARKLFINDKRMFGSKAVIPVDGLVNIDHEGAVIVSDEAAVHLLTIEGWSDPLIVEAEKAALEANEGNVTTGEIDAKSSLEGADLDQLAELDLDQLISLAKEGEISGWEKFAKNKVALAKYLKSQINKKLKATK